MQFAALVPRCRGLVAEDLATGRFEAGAPAAVDPLFYVGPACQAALATQTRCMAEAESQFSRGSLATPAASSQATSLLLRG